MFNSKYEEIISEYHQELEFTPLLNLPIRIKNYILYGKDPLHRMAVLTDCDGFLNAKGRLSLIENYDRFLGDENPMIKTREKELKELEEETIVFPENFKKFHKERMSIFAECKVTSEQDNIACWKAAYKTVPVKGGWETFSKLHKIGYGIFIVSAARELAVKRFGRIKFGIPESQIIGTPYIFKNSYLTDEISEENEFVFYYNKPKRMERILFEYNCFPTIVMTDDPVADRPFILSGLDLSLVASEKEILHGKKILYLPKAKDDLRVIINPILAMQRAKYVSRLISREKLFKIIETSKTTLNKGKKYLKNDFEKIKKEFLINLHELFSIKDLPFPISKYKIRRKITELKTSSDKEHCKEITRNLVNGIEKYLIESRLPRKYIKKFRKIIPQ